jgi:cytochrome P450
MRADQVIVPAIRELVSRPRLADVLFRFDRWGNPFDPINAVDPFPAWKHQKQTDGPVVHRKLYQQWFIYGYEEARFVLSSDAFITSNQMETLLGIRPYTKLTTQAQEFMKLWLLLVDPPVHTRLRRLVNKAFTPRRVAELEPRVAALVDELLDQLDEQTVKGRPTVEIMSAFCDRLPVAVIAEMLGLPRERWEWSQRTTDSMVQLLSPFDKFDIQPINDVIADVHYYWGQLADERLADPQDDLMTALVQAEDDGDRLTRQELVAVIAFLMGAGHETTTNLLGNSIVHLARNPEQRALVQADPGLWPNAVEELIRFDSSVKIAPRATVRDVEVGGTTIPAGQNVLVQVSAANRDERRFDRPDDLLLDRDDPSPISFGHGMHHCLGAALARMELRLGLSKFVERFGDYTIDEQTLDWKWSSTLRGPSHLDVTHGAGDLAT